MPDVSTGFEPAAVFVYVEVLDCPPKRIGDVATVRRVIDWESARPTIEACEAYCREWYGGTDYRGVICEATVKLRPTQVVGDVEAKPRQGVLFEEGVLTNA